MAFGAEQNRVLCFLKAKAPFAPEPDFRQRNGTTNDKTIGTII